jgi:K+/H+ antiporter YhaU regulatory subunit KhtT
MSDVLVRGQRLPGLGWRYDLVMDDGRQLLIVVEDRGPRHLMIVDARADEPLTSLRLSPEQATTFAALLTGARFTVAPAPAPAEGREEVLATPGVVVDTVRIDKGSPAVGQRPERVESLLGTDVALLGVISDDTPDIVETDPGRALRVGDRLVVAARPDGLTRVREAV